MKSAYLFTLARLGKWDGLVIRYKMASYSIKSLINKLSLTYYNTCVLLKYRSLGQIKSFFFIQNR